MEPKPQVGKIQAQEKELETSGMFDCAAVDIVKNSVCRILTSDGKKGRGSGFLATVELLNEDLGDLHGLFTNNHVLDADALYDGSPIYCLNEGRRFTIEPRDYCFTCPALDVTFVSIKDEEIMGGLATFPRLAMADISAPEQKEHILIYQHPQGRGGRKMQSQGAITKLHGDINFYHTASTHYGSSGSPVVNTEGDIVPGIHKAREGDQLCNVAVRMDIVMFALDCDYDDTRTTWCRDMVYPIGLNESQHKALESLGVDQLDKRGILFRSPQPTPVWLYRSTAQWYWTHEEFDVGRYAGNHPWFIVGIPRGEGYWGDDETTKHLASKGKNSAANLAILRYVSSNAKGFFWITNCANAF